MVGLQRWDYGLEEYGIGYGQPQNQYVYFIEGFGFTVC